MFTKKPALPPLIDIHSHILPGVDDGARKTADALEMLWMAVKDGVMIQVLTPHLHEGRYPNTRQSLGAAFREFQDVVREARIPIELRLSAEVRIGPEIMEMVDADQIPWLGTWNGQATFLLEFPQTSVPAGSINLVQWLRKQDILPIIAHPERNTEFQNSPEKLMPFLDAGCPLQITASSLLGNFGRAARRAAIELLQEGEVALIATDCHNRNYRPPVLSQGVRAAAKIVGHAEAVRMSADNPVQILGGRPLQMAAG